ncbi:uncharacterized protein LOC109709168 [Ananas comosus]|uniref:Uncharacterized protein LOC109709168 n=1 Tax=Ananas comosus TaxID=4615 RepID=A0A6P5ETP2_ANACO|nr:uncharacterized protein LOC109709168 [Ananas comosus]
MCCKGFPPLPPLFLHLYFLTFFLSFFILCQFFGELVSYGHPHVLFLHFGWSFQATIFSPIRADATHNSRIPKECCTKRRYRRTINFSTMEEDWPIESNDHCIDYTVTLLRIDLHCTYLFGSFEL